MWYLVVQRLLVNFLTMLVIMEALGQLGLGKPYQRMVFGAAVAGGVAYALKMPEASFNTDGSMRPWKLTSGEDSATWLPFFLIPLAGATAFGVFI